MFYEKLYDRAVELHNAGAAKKETTEKLDQMRKELIEEDRSLLSDAGYSEKSVNGEIEKFSERLENYCGETVNELYS